MMKRKSKDNQQLQGLDSKLVELKKVTINFWIWFT